MAGEKFCLRWNDFETNISTAFQELREDKDFFDVTLACGDEQIQAHKVILSACSQFFRNILRRNLHQHPLLYMKGVKFADLQSVLNFMYHGEVNVAQEELNSFLAVAEDLRVKGLTQNQPVGSAKGPSDFIPKTLPGLLSKVRDEPKPKSSQLTPINTHVTTDDDDIQEVVSIKSEPLAAPPQHQLTAPPPRNVYSAQPTAQVPAPVEAQMVEYQNESFDDYGEYDGDQHGYEGSLLEGRQDEAKDGSLDAKIDSLMGKTAAGELQCLMCGRTSNVRQNIRNHIETHVASAGFPCDLCGKQYKTRNSLNKHKSLYHKNSAQNNYAY